MVLWQPGTGQVRGGDGAFGDGGWRWMGKEENGGVRVGAQNR